MPETTTAVNFYEPGVRLPNGATVIAASTRNAHEWILLAYKAHPTYTGGPSVEYVTWKCSRPGDGSDTVHGHYFGSIGEAARDFETRP
jgi:hypothetical protein